MCSCARVVVVDLSSECVCTHLCDGVNALLCVVWWCWCWLHCVCVVLQWVLWRPGVSAVAEQRLWRRRSYHTGLRDRLQHGHRYRSVTRQPFLTNLPVTCLSFRLTEVSGVSRSLGCDPHSKWWSSVAVVIINWLQGDDVAAERLYPAVEHLPRSLQSDE